MKTLSLLVLLVPLFWDCQREHITAPQVDTVYVSAFNDVEFSFWQVKNTSASTYESVTQEEYWCGDIFNLTPDTIRVEWCLKRYFTWTDYSAEENALIYMGKIGLIGGVAAPPGMFRYRLAEEYAYLPPKGKPYSDGGGLVGMAQFFNYVPTYTYNPLAQHPFTRIAIQLTRGRKSTQLQYNGVLHEIRPVTERDFHVDIVQVAH